MFNFYECDKCPVVFFDKKVYTKHVNSNCEYKPANFAKCCNKDITGKINTPDEVLNSEYQKFVKIKNENIKNKQIINSKEPFLQKMFCSILKEISNPKQEINRQNFVLDFLCIHVLFTLDNTILTHKRFDSFKNKIYHGDDFAVDDLKYTQISNLLSINRVEDFRQMIKKIWQDCYGNHAQLQYLFTKDQVLLLSIDTWFYQLPTIYEWYKQYSYYTRGQTLLLNDTFDLFTYINTYVNGKKSKLMSTPIKLITQIKNFVEKIPINSHFSELSIYNPCCGNGYIITYLLDVLLEKLPALYFNINACEENIIVYTELLLNMFINYKDIYNIRCADCVYDNTDTKYNCVIVDVPFASQPSIKVTDINKYVVDKTKNNVEEIYSSVQNAPFYRVLEHSLYKLEDNGLAIFIFPAIVLSKPSKLRDKLATMKIHSLLHYPSDSFPNCTKEFYVLIASKTTHSDKSFIVYNYNKYSEEFVEDTLLYKDKLNIPLNKLEADIPELKSGFVTLETIATITKGKAPVKDKNGQYKIIGGGRVPTKDMCSLYNTKENTILMALNGSIGVISKYNEKVWINERCCSIEVINPELILEDYLHYYLCGSRECLESLKVEKSGAPKLELDSVKNFPIKILPIEAQEMYIKKAINKIDIDNFFSKEREKSLKEENEQIRFSIDIEQFGSVGTYKFSENLHIFPFNSEELIRQNLEIIYKDEAEDICIVRKKDALFDSIMISRILDCVSYAKEDRYESYREFIESITFNEEQVENMEYYCTEIKNYIRNKRVLLAFKRICYSNIF
jgi:uncharacterized C2H2 Zn-finger protein